MSLTQTGDPVITPRKSLGQNFLRDPNTIRKIVAAAGAPAGASVVEIGPGLGALTGPLLARYPDLIALEVDERAVAHLKTALPDLDVRHADVLETDWAALAAEKAGPLYVVGNLPYYITSQILFGLLDGHVHIRRAVVMMQREVAERLVAVPRTKAYGILSVMTQLFAEPQLLFRVSRHVFYPKPDVNSAVVGLTLKPHLDLPDGLDVETLRRLVRMAFNQRRKTLRNSLRRWTIETGHSVPDSWAGCRAEELTPPAFIALAESMTG